MYASQLLPQGALDIALNNACFEILVQTCGNLVRCIEDSDSSFAVYIGVEHANLYMYCLILCKFLIISKLKAKALVCIYACELEIDGFPDAEAAKVLGDSEAGAATCLHHDLSPSGSAETSEELIVQLVSMLLGIELCKVHQVPSSELHNAVE